MNNKYISEEEVLLNFSERIKYYQELNRLQRQENFSALVGAGLGAVVGAGRGLYRKMTGKANEDESMLGHIAKGAAIGAGVGLVKSVIEPKTPLSIKDVKDYFNKLPVETKNKIKNSKKTGYVLALLTRNRRDYELCLYNEKKNEILSEVIKFKNAELSDGLKRAFGDKDLLIID